MSVFHFSYMLYMHKKALKWKAASNLEGGEGGRGEEREGKKPKENNFQFPKGEMGMTSPEFFLIFFQNNVPNQPDLARHFGSYEALSPGKHASVRVLD